MIMELGVCRDYTTRNHDSRIRNRDAPCTMNLWMNVCRLYKLCQLKK